MKSVKAIVAATARVHAPAGMTAFLTNKAFHAAATDRLAGARLAWLLSRAPAGGPLRVVPRRRAAGRARRGHRRARRRGARPRGRRRGRGRGGDPRELAQRRHPPERRHPPRRGPPLRPCVAPARLIRTSTPPPRGEISLPFARWYLRWSHPVADRRFSARAWGTSLLLPIGCGASCSFLFSDVDERRCDQQIVFFLLPVRKELARK